MIPALERRLGTTNPPSPNSPLSYRRGQKQIPPLARPKPFGRKWRPVVCQKCPRCCCLMAGCDNTAGCPRRNLLVDRYWSLVYLVRLLASNLDRPGSIPGGYAMIEIVEMVICVVFPTMIRTYYLLKQSAVLRLKVGLDVTLAATSLDIEPETYATVVRQLQFHMRLTWDSNSARSQLHYGGTRGGVVVSIVDCERKVCEFDSRSGALVGRLHFPTWMLSEQWARCGQLRTSVEMHHVGHKHLRNIVPPAREIHWRFADMSYKLELSLQRVSDWPGKLVRRCSSLRSSAHRMATRLSTSIPGTRHDQMCSADCGSTKRRSDTKTFQHNVPLKFRLGDSSYRLFTPITDCTVRWKHCRILTLWQLNKTTKVELRPQPCRTYETLQRPFGWTPQLLRAAVAERLYRSPPTRANRVQSPAGWESCRTMPLVGGFSRGGGGDLPFPSPFSFQCCSILTSITFIGSQDFDVKSSPDIFTHLSSYHICLPTSSNGNTCEDPYNLSGDPARWRFSNIPTRLTARYERSGFDSHTPISSSSVLSTRLERKHFLAGSRFDFAKDQCVPSSSKVRMEDSTARTCVADSTKEGTYSTTVDDPVKMSKVVSILLEFPGELYQRSCNLRHGIFCEIKNLNHMDVLPHCVAPPREVITVAIRRGTERKTLYIRLGYHRPCCFDESTKFIRCGHGPKKQCILVAIQEPSDDVCHMGSRIVMLALNVGDNNRLQHLREVAVSEQRAMVEGWARARD
ncbi:hypothetical protein PR048_024692 [Dryococelus australis]|uniref:Uncharacterized protein n=1 Tax=Dryococelus australis TaxID=614101 RepID=A0ABQ9GP93_9NEOP|nr:hypothetical protein PR048_024692 [Dryococelus australis]